MWSPACCSVVALSVGRAAGRRARRTPVGLAGARARHDAGLQRAPADLVLRPPHPRPLGRRLALPGASSGLQQDVRRRAAPRHADLRRRVLLGRPRDATSRRSSPRSGRARSAPTTSASRSGSRSRRFRPRSPERWARARSRSRLGQPWQIAILLAVFGSLLWIADQTPQSASLRRPRPRAGDPRRHLADPRADAGRLALGDHDHDRSVLRADPRCRGALLLPAARPDRARRGSLQGRQGAPSHPLPAGSTGPFVVGTIAAAAIGLVAIDLLLGYVRNHSYAPFAIYRIVLAILIAVAILSGWRAVDVLGRPERPVTGLETIRRRPGFRHFRSGRAARTMPQCAPLPSSRTAARRRTRRLGSVLSPAQALARLGHGDIALGRLDVLPSLDGVEPGLLGARPARGARRHRAEPAPSARRGARQADDRGAALRGEPAAPAHRPHRAVARAA